MRVLVVLDPDPSFFRKEGHKCVCPSVSAEDDGGCNGLSFGETWY